MHKKSATYSGKLITIFAFSPGILYLGTSVVPSLEMKEEGKLVFPLISSNFGTISSLDESPVILNFISFAKKAPSSFGFRRTLIWISATPMLSECLQIYNVSP